MVGLTGFEISAEALLASANALLASMYAFHDVAEIGQSEQFVASLVPRMFHG
jgi:hypothetical protein